jgi:hypothetical protein
VVVMMVMMMMMMVTMCSRPNADVNAGAMMVMMVVSDHNLGGPRTGALCQTLIVDF